MHRRGYIAAGMAAAWVSAWAADSSAELPFGPETVADVAERVTPAVVSITTERTRGEGEPQPNFRDFFFGPGRRPRRETGAGSGVVVSADGFIVTNNHVIDGADTIKVSFTDQRVYSAKLIGADKPSDIALIKIEAKTLPHVQFGDSAKLRLGEFVLAIGNPFGVGQTVTMGIVSATRRGIGIVDYENFIQTDAAINPGNSGGALVNLRGELVGINTAILSKSGGAQGIGFAVPTNMVRPILDQIRSHGRVRRGWLGVAIQDLTPDLAKSLSLSGVEGVLLSDIMVGGPAAKGGLKPGDVVQAVNGKTMTSSADLRNEIAMLTPGSKATLAVLRDGKQFEVRVLLDEKNEDDAAPQAVPVEESLMSGMGVQPLTDEIREHLNVPAELKGVVVTHVEPGTAAAEAGMSEGDVITSVNRKNVEAPTDVQRAISPKEGKILLRIWRQGHYLFVVIRN